MITTATIKLDDLLINTENFRYETVNDQKEAIDKVLKEQDKKLVNLAQHILILTSTGKMTTPQLRIE